MRVHLFALSLACVAIPPSYGAWWLGVTKAHAACKPQNVITEAVTPYATIIGHGIEWRTAAKPGYKVSTRCGSDMEVQGIDSGAIEPPPHPTNYGTKLRFRMIIGEEAQVRGWKELPNGVIVKQD